MPKKSETPPPAGTASAPIVTKARPRKRDGGHTIVERRDWTTSGGRPMTSWVCECGHVYPRGYDDRWIGAHARHVKAATAES